MPVYTTFMGGFGDAWGAANYFLHLSEEAGHPTKVTNLDPRIRSILPYLSSNGRVEEVETPADILIHSHPDPSLLQMHYPHPVPALILDWGVVYEKRFFPTKAAVWSPNCSRRIAIQLIARYPQDKKSCSQEHETYLMNAMAAAGYHLLPLGLPTSLEENIRIAANAQAFVGVCSGMSHLCHSVGIPVHLITNGHNPNTLTACHRGNPYEVYKNVFDVVEHFCKPNACLGDIDSAANTEW